MDKRVQAADTKRLGNYRSVDIKAEVRATEGDGKKMVLRGYPILFNTPTIIRDWYGEWEEIIAPTALDSTNLIGVYLMVGHNPDNVLGREGINMRLEKDEIGMFFECELPNTQYARDWYNLVEQRIVDGMSWSFNCEGDTWNYKKDGMERDQRIINKVTKLWEITITPFPAYAEASVIAANSQHTDTGEKTAKPDAGINTDAAEKARAELANKFKKLEAL